MRWLAFLALFLVVSWSTAILAADYTVTTNAAQEALLTSVVAGINAERVTRIPPAAAITNEQYLRSLLVGHFQVWRQQQIRYAVEAAGAWSTLTAGQKTAICAHLSLSPCPQ